MQYWAIGALGAGLAIAPLQATAQDIAAGGALYAETCRNCHGPKAQGMASFPKLSDMSADDLAARLEKYRAGEKVGPNSALMQPHAADLSDDDIANLAAFIATGIE